MHNYADIPNLMKKNLDFLGYENVDFIFYADEKFKYKNLSEKLHNLFRKSILRDKNFKEKLRKAFIEKTLLQKAQNLPNYDIILVMNTDFFSDSFLQILKTKTKNLIGNHWDGLSRTPEIYSKINIFDKFYVFDKSDVNEKNNIFFLTNFYFDFDLHEATKEEKQDVFYLGTYVKNRFDILKKVSQILTKNNISQKIVLFSWEKEKNEGAITFTNEFMSYEENVKNVQESKALLDLKLKEHNGLSFRFFEALKYHKKLITNNSDVKTYDFYNKENIFILGEDSESELISFTESPYIEIPEKTREKYSFKNWFTTLTS